MATILLLFLTLLHSPLAAQSGSVPTDPVLATRIKLLVTAELTGNDENTDREDAEVRKIFSTYGLPTISEVGDEAAYDFIFLLSSNSLLPELQGQTLLRLRAASAHDEIPADAGVFYETRVRLLKTKELARKSTPENPGLRDQIERLVKIDQVVRQQKGFDAEKMAETDAQNAPALQQILDKYGVPSYAMVGPQAAGDFVLMIQHQPARFREQVLPKLKALVDRDQADPGSYAMVYDASQRDLGRKQLYGERLECAAGEKMHEAPIEDEEHVNQRRAELGLMRVELYAWVVAKMMPQFCPAASKPAPKEVR